MTAFPTVPGQFAGIQPPLDEFGNPIPWPFVVPPLEQLQAAGIRVPQSLLELTQLQGQPQAQMPLPPQAQMPPPPQSPDLATLMAIQAAQQHQQIGPVPEANQMPQAPMLGASQAVPPPDMRQRQGPQIPDWLVGQAAAAQQRDAELAQINATAIEMLRARKDLDIDRGGGAFGRNRMEQARSLYREDVPADWAYDMRRQMHQARAGELPTGDPGPWFGPAKQREGQEIPRAPEFEPRPSFELTPEQQANIKARKEERDRTQGLITARARDQSPAGYRADIGEASPVDLAMLGGAEAAATHPDILSHAAEEAERNRQVEMFKAQYAAAVAGAGVEGMTPAMYMGILERAGGGGGGALAQQITPVLGAREHVQQIAPHLVEPFDSAVGAGDHAALKTISLQTGMPDDLENGLLSAVPRETTLREDISQSWMDDPVLGALGQGLASVLEKPLKAIGLDILDQPPPPAPVGGTSENLTNIARMMGSDPKVRELVRQRLRTDREFAQSPAGRYLSQVLGEP